MTPTETATILRNYNLWRRGNLEGMPQPDPREIGEAIDAAVEMIDRLEAAEKELESWKGLAQQLGNEVGALRFRLERRQDELNRLRANLESAEKERDALRARIEAMEKQEPVAWVRKLGLDLPSVVCVTDLKYRPSNIPESSYIPIYLAPGAQGEEK